MKRWALLLGEIGRVDSFDYPYMKHGRKLPDRHDTLLAAHREARKKARGRSRRRLILVGKSMGGRIGCHLALEQPVSALVCLGYPLVSPGKKRVLRDEVLKQLRTPVLFVQGTRDRLCPLDLLAKVRRQMSAPNQLHVVDTGDHSLLATKTWLKEHHATQDDVDQETCAAIAAFVENDHG